MTTFVGTYHYVQSRNGTWHRVTLTESVVRSHERCNLDDSKIAATQTYEPPPGERRCKWCYAPSVF